MQVGVARELDYHNVLATQYQNSQRRLSMISVTQEEGMQSRKNDVLSDDLSKTSK